MCDLDLICRVRSCTHAWVDKKAAIAVVSLHSGAVLWKLHPMHIDLFLY